MRGNSVGWTSFEVVAALAIGALLVAGFVVWEVRAGEPMLPMRFFRLRAFSAGNGATFFQFAAMFAAVFFFAQHLQTVLGYGALDAGLRLVPWTATLLLVAPIAGALADRIGNRFQPADSGMGFSEMLVPSIVTGIGASMVIPTSANAVVGAVGLDSVGKAAGANGLLRELGGVFGVAVAVAVFAAAGSYASPDAFSDGFAAAIGVAAGLSLLRAIVGLGTPDPRGSDPAPVQPATAAKVSAGA